MSQSCQELRTQSPLRLNHHVNRIPRILPVPHHLRGHDGPGHCGRIVPTHSRANVVGNLGRRGPLLLPPVRGGPANSEGVAQRPPSRGNRVVASGMGRCCCAPRGLVILVLGRSRDRTSLLPRCRALCVCRRVAVRRHGRRQPTGTRPPVTSTLGNRTAIRDRRRSSFVGRACLFLLRLLPLCGAGSIHWASRRKVQHWWLVFPGLGYVPW